MTCFAYIRGMREKVGNRIIRYVLLMAGILMLLSVMVPHHHHADGSPCYKPLTERSAHNNTDSGVPGDCSCDSHNLFLLHSANDIGPHLFPHLVLFEHFNASDDHLYQWLLRHERPVYIESLHDSWIARATGLRAPPRI